MASISNDDEDASLADKTTFIRIIKKENDDVKLPDQKLVEGTPLLSIEEQAIAAEERARLLLNLIDADSEVER